MLNYFNFKPFDDEFLLTNDIGRHIFLTKNEFSAVLTGSDLSMDLQQRLRDRFFLYNEHEAVFAERTKHPLRDMKRYLFSATSLHIFVLTNVCNMSCIYCQAKDDTTSTPCKMSKETAERCVDIALSSPVDYLSFEFQGGEPLANFEVLQYIVLYTEAHKGHKEISYSLVSNLTLLTDEILDFLLEYRVSISTSIDGPSAIHDYNRPLRNGVGSYRAVQAVLQKLRERNCEFGAIQTTTRRSLSHAKEIVDSYIESGLTNVFIRPLTKLGTAARVWNEIGYTAKEFLSFYEQCLLYIIERNKQGIDLCENHAVIFLQKILGGYAENYMELRSPCGATIGQLAYFYDGNIFTCDEGRMLYEMGREDFRLGNAFENDYDSLVQSPVCKAVCVASLLEGQLNCCDCVYQPYCGTCPVLTLAQENDLFFKDRHAFRCEIYGGILEILFRLIKENNAEVMKIINNWIKVETYE